jgi:hypothetical protein
MLWESGVLEEGARGRSDPTRNHKRRMLSCSEPWEGKRRDGNVKTKRSQPRLCKTVARSMEYTPSVLSAMIEREIAQTNTAQGVVVTWSRDWEKSPVAPKTGNGVLKCRSSSGTELLGYR